MEIWECPGSSGEEVSRQKPCAGRIDFARAFQFLKASIKITTPKGVVIFMVEAGRVELPSENPSMETSPGADGYSGRRDRPVPLAPGKPSRLEVR